MVPGNLSLSSVSDVSVRELFDQVDCSSEYSLMLTRHLPVNPTETVNTCLQSFVRRLVVDSHQHYHSEDSKNNNR